jgi:hypothetical protein
MKQKKLKKLPFEINKNYLKELKDIDTVIFICYLEYKAKDKKEITLTIKEMNKELSQYLENPIDVYEKRKTLDFLGIVTFSTKQKVKKLKCKEQEIDYFYNNLIDRIFKKHQRVFSKDIKPIKEKQATIECINTVSILKKLLKLTGANKILNKIDKKNKQLEKENEDYYLNERVTYKLLFKNYYGRNKRDA